MDDLLKQRDQFTERALLQLVEARERNIVIAHARAHLDDAPPWVGYAEARNPTTNGFVLSWPCAFVAGETEAAMYDEAKHLAPCQVWLIRVDGRCSLEERCPFAEDMKLAA